MQVSLDSETVLIEFEDRNLICSLCSIIKIQVRICVTPDIIFLIIAQSLM